MYFTIFGNMSIIPTYYQTILYPPCVQASATSRWLPQAASCSAVLPATSLRLTWRRRNGSSARCPLAAAQCSGVAPGRQLRLTGSMLIPRSSFF